MKNVIELAKIYGLKPKERQFLKVYFSTFDKQKAYLESHLTANVTKESLLSVSSRYYQRIKAKLDWPAFLEVVGLGIDRLALEIEKGFTAKKTEFYQGKAVAQCEDNAVRARTRELLADLHGLRKQEVRISGEIKTRAEPDFSNFTDQDFDDAERLAAKAQNGEAANRN